MQVPPPDWYADPFDATQLRWWDGAQWTPHTTKSSPWLIPVIAGALVLVLIGAVALGVAGAVVVTHYASAPFGAQSLKRLQLTDTESPATMGRAQPSPSKQTTTAAAIASDQGAEKATPKRCRSLTYAEPALSTDAASKDPSQPLGIFAGDPTADGDNSFVVSVARRFASTAAASGHLASLARTTRACSAGYSTPFFRTRAVTSVQPKVNGMSVTGWSERDATIAGSAAGGTPGSGPGTTEMVGTYYVLDIQRANVVVRAACYIPADSKSGAKPCADLWDTVVSKLRAL